MNEISVAGPYTYQNLSLYLLLGEDTFDGSRFIPLDEALERKCVVVHETGNVGQLEVENLSEGFDLYIQAGDVVKGGRQDRTLGVDFVLPAKFGRVPIPSFCVESGRWHRRAAEDAGSFSSSKAYLASRKLRLAAKLSKSQSDVWQEVAETQQNFSESIRQSVAAEASPTSYQLAVENADLQKLKETWCANFERLIDEQPRAVGFAFAINGQLNTADVYGSGVLFRKLWSKLLHAAVLEAIGELARTPVNPAPLVSVEALRQWLGAAQEARLSAQQAVPPRVRVDTRHAEKTVTFDTCDQELQGAVLHRNVVAS